MIFPLLLVYTISGAGTDGYSSDMKFQFLKLIKVGQID